MIMILAYLYVQIIWILIVGLNVSSIDCGSPWWLKKNVARYKRSPQADQILNNPFLTGETLSEGISELKALPQTLSQRILSQNNATQLLQLHDINPFIPPQTQSTSFVRTVENRTHNRQGGVSLSKSSANIDFSNSGITGSFGDSGSILVSTQYYLHTKLTGFLNQPRNSFVEPSLKEISRSAIYHRFRDYGLKVLLQNFTATEVVDILPPELLIDGVLKGVNIIGELTGQNRGSPEDGILVVGAHYDTVFFTNGVDDNGSGVAAMLEVARILSVAQCRLTNTVLFVAFDLEELGGLGSHRFVHEYLFPRELQHGRGYFQGAFILDSVLNYNGSIGSQDLPEDFQTVLPSLTRYLQLGGSIGDFLAMFSRDGVDSTIAQRFQKAWERLSKDEYRLINTAIRLPARFPPASLLTSHLSFLRSDHVMFWYHNNTNFPTLNAVLLTDTGPFRGRMRECYHAPCDDARFLTKENIEFLRKTTDALVLTLLDLGGGTCEGLLPLALRNRSGPILQLHIELVSIFIFVLRKFHISSCT
ncbi:uncharacterized protein LOC106467485 isoform X2 [Limulus polyphemus]|uniref:Uncharacterized protein LOC106467485 isoform X2 n=1 Tax=Limulus polyphemus TaxID=6850 RepID=A0ABM1T685_LIMPO|nr:uncharacterized protein LOC106467485 isoform X2 [Limulus polyphemus]